MGSAIQLHFFGYFDSLWRLQSRLVYSVGYCVPHGFSGLVYSHWFDRFFFAQKVFFLLLLLRPFWNISLRERERKKRSFLHYYTIITKVWLEKKITFDFYKGLRPPKPGMQSHQKGSQPPPNHLFWLPVPVQLADCRIYHCYTVIEEKIHFFSTQTKDAK